VVVNYSKSAKDADAVASRVRDAFTLGMSLAPAFVPADRA